MYEPEIYNNGEDGTIDYRCGCCGENYEEGLYENPWGGVPGQIYGIGRECIMNCIEDDPDEGICVDEQYWKNEYKKLLEIRRNKLLDIVIRPLQIKIKKMLYSPYTRRGKAFIEKSIEWAYE